MKLTGDKLQAALNSQQETVIVVRGDGSETRGISPMWAATTIVGAVFTGYARNGVVSKIVADDARRPEPFTNLLRLSWLLCANCRNTCVRSKVAVLFAGFVRTQDGSNPLIQTADIVPFEPGTTARLKAGEGVEFSTPPDVGISFDPPIRAQLRANASGRDIPYEYLSGDLSDWLDLPPWDTRNYMIITDPIPPLSGRGDGRSVSFLTQSPHIGSFRGYFRSFSV